VEENFNTVYILPQIYKGKKNLRGAKSIKGPNTQGGLELSRENTLCEENNYGPLKNV